jgi:hypothetical protein
MGCKSFAGISAAVDSTFENIPKDTLKILVGSMRKRLQRVIDDGGAKCGYYITCG